MGNCCLYLLPQSYNTSIVFLLVSCFALQVALLLDLLNEAWISSCLLRSFGYTFLNPAPTCCFQIPIVFSFVFPAVTSHQLCPRFLCHPQGLLRVQGFYCASPCKQQERGAAVPSFSGFMYSNCNRWPQKVSKASQLYKCKITKSFPKGGMSQGPPEAHHSKMTLSSFCLHLPRLIIMDIFQFKEGKLMCVACFSSFCFVWVF